MENAFSKFAHLQVQARHSVSWLHVLCYLSQMIWEKTNWNLPNLTGCGSHPANGEMVCVFRNPSKRFLVKSSTGEATGPIGFLRVYDNAFGEIAQGGTRRGANMAVLRIDHPDIEDFIQCKTNENQITNFNISVGITDAFMQAVLEDRMWDLRFPDVYDPAYREFEDPLKMRKLPVCQSGFIERFEPRFIRNDRKTSSSQR